MLVLIASMFVILLTGLGALRLIYRPPSLVGRNSSFSAVQSSDSRLAKILAQASTGSAFLSGIHIIDDDREAFIVRRDLIRTSDVSIDIQCYMWHADLTGRLLMSEILQAAVRGVRVRLLLDDNTTAGTDHMLVAANHHPNIEVRLFNPFILRTPRAPNYLFDFRRVNRRMHNKSLTVDGIATIVGGRNVGDEYFSAHAEFRFADMDVLAIGAIVADVAKSFDAYWNCNSSYPLQDVVLSTDIINSDRVLSALKKLPETQEALRYSVALGKGALLDESKSIDFEWVPVQLVADDPAKGLGSIPRRKLLISGLEKRLGDTSKAIDVVTAYFVPGRIGTKYLSAAVKAGKIVRVLTNSLASNDVVPVHAGYARYRKRLLRHGVALHELRANRGETSNPRKGKKKLPRFGASSSSLHAKVFVMDKAKVFIGSFNFDPRSLYLNCEMGLMIESPKLGSSIAAQMDQLIATQTYHPFIDAGGRLSWRDSKQRVHRMEPESTIGQRVGAWVISWLPVEWLL